MLVSAWGGGGSTITTYDGQGRPNATDYTQGGICTNNRICIT